MCGSQTIYIPRFSDLVRKISHARVIVNSLVHSVVLIVLCLRVTELGCNQFGELDLLILIIKFYQSIIWTRFKNIYQSLLITTPTNNLCCIVELNSMISMITLCLLFCIILDTVEIRNTSSYMSIVYLVSISITWSRFLLYFYQLDYPKEVIIKVHSP